MSRRLDPLEGLVRIKRFFTGLAIAALVVVVLLTTLKSLAWVTPASLLNLVGIGPPNAAPTVVPSLREWHGASGSFTLNSSSRIALDPTSSPTLQATAKVFQADLSSVAQRTPRIVVTDSPQPGDFYLSLAGADQGLGDEGYTLAVGESAVIRARTATGIFYGTRTALQILVQDAAHAHLPRGTARDYPAYKERGFMLDVARKFFPLSELEDYVRMMSWYKLNDFHLHLSDDEGFRLNSANFPGLAAKDGSYSKQDMRTLQDLAEARGVTITPEIDGPAHSRAITQFRPDLAISSNPGFLDLSNPNTFTFMNSLWDEFVPWFDAKQVDIGADEYDPGLADSYRQFVNTYDQYLRGKGKTVRMWGELGEMKSAIAANTDITLEIWDTSKANPADMDHQGFSIINADGSLLYIVPYTNLPFFHDSLDLAMLYQKWEPNVFDSGTLDSSDPRLLGGSFSVWIDQAAKTSDADVYNRVKPAVPVLGQKMWSGPTPNTSFDQFQQLVKATSAVPGALPAPH